MLEGNYVVESREPSSRGQRLSECSEAPKADYSSARRCIFRKPTNFDQFLLEDRSFGNGVGQGEEKNIGWLSVGSRSAKGIGYPSGRPHI